jgi:hypothetical protein
MATETVYVALPDEGTPVWVPIVAEHVQDDVYRVVYCNGGNIVKFREGSLVKCRLERLSFGNFLVAYAHAP